MATKIILLAAGLTDWDQERRIQGGLKIPLNDEGRAQIQVRADELRALKPKIIYTAETLSASQTAELVAKDLKLRTKLMPELNEVGFGLWQGLLIEEVKSRHPKAFKRWLDNPPAVCPPEGEPIERAVERVAKALQTIAKRHHGDTVVVVCPGAAAVLAKCVLTDRPVEKLSLAADNSGSLEVFETGE